MTEKIKNITVYVDMDGVIADFDGALRDKLGLSFNGDHKGKVWGKIQKHNDTVEPWFYSLPKMADADKLWDFVTTHFENVEVLSASGTTPRDAPGQKKAWMGDHFGYDVVVHVVQSSSDKAKYANANSILIDDREKSTKPFMAAGGMTILHKNADTTIAALKVMMEDWD